MQQEFFKDILRNQHNAKILERWQAIDLPDCWLVAGCLFQTLWNLRSGRSAETDIRDYDLFYFDGQDLSAEAERAVQARIDRLFEDLGVKIEASNQARVHVWYESYFGHPYAPLKSSKDGIDHFLVKETCVGVRPGEVYAPHGIAAVYSGDLSPNPLAPHDRLFQAKAASYQERWTWLQVKL